MVFLLFNKKHTCTFGGKQVVPVDNDALINLLQQTGLSSNPNIQEAMRVLRLQDKMVRAMPHIVRNRNKQNGKLLAVKEIKAVFGLSLYDSKMLMDLCWTEPDPHTLTIIEPMQKHFDMLQLPENIMPTPLQGCKYAFEYDADFHIFLNENGVLAMPLQKF